MYCQFNDEEISLARDKLVDDAAEKHAMTTEHTEIIGQFLDHTGLSPDDLKRFLLLSIERFNSYGWALERPVECVTLYHALWIDNPPMLPDHVYRQRIAMAIAKDMYDRGVIHYWYDEDGFRPGPHGGKGMTMHGMVRALGPQEPLPLQKPF